MTALEGTRMQRLGYRAPADVPEPEQLVLVEYVSGGQVAIVTLNRPHADNAVTTELAAQLIEILETIDARASVRVAILTSAGDRAFSVGGDLYQRKQMTREQWLRQRQVFDRVLLHAAPAAPADHRRRPRHGLRRWLRDGHQLRLHHRVRRCRLRPARGHGRPLRRRRLAGLPAPAPASRAGPCRC